MDCFGVAWAWLAGSELRRTPLKRSSRGYLIPLIAPSRCPKPSPGRSALVAAVTCVRLHQHIIPGDMRIPSSAVLARSGRGYAELRHNGVLRSSPVSYGTDLHGALSAQPRGLLDDPAASPREVALIIRAPTRSRRLVDEAPQRTTVGRNHLLRSGGRSGKASSSARARARASEGGTTPLPSSRRR